MYRPGVNLLLGALFEVGRLFERERLICFLYRRLYIKLSLRQDNKSCNFK